MLKALGFLNADGAPTERYYRYLDQTEAGKVLAEGLRDAYADLYQLNRNAHALSRSELKNKLKTLTQGQHSESVITKMAGTFGELAKRADFSASSAPVGRETVGESPEEETPSTAAERETKSTDASPPGGAGIALGGLVYSIQIHLPESRDQAVYDALFRSLKTHLLQ